MERFNRTVLDEFFRLAFRIKFYESLAALQAELDAWLDSDNYERPHLGIGIKEKVTSRVLCQG